MLHNKEPQCIMHSYQPAMGTLRIADVKNAIASARKHTKYETSLHHLIDTKIPILQPILAIPKGGEVAPLSAFVQLYIDRCTDCLEACGHLTIQTHIESYTIPYIETTIQYFFDAHPVIDNLSGGHALLCRAYLCHRMLEELNDQIMMERSWPLIPMDMSHVNLIVHTLIGEEPANLLDQTILINMELIRSQAGEEAKVVFQQEESQQQLASLCRKGWQWTREQWPFLNEDMMSLII